LRKPCEQKKRAERRGDATPVGVKVSISRSGSIYGRILTSKGRGAHNPPNMAESSKDVITIIASITGMVLGTAGFVLSLVNYFRDRAKIRVRLQWDMAVTPGDPRYDPRKKYAVISVLNIGRRPVYLGAVALRLPKGFKATHLLAPEAIGGKKLEEGGPPMIVTLQQDNLEEYSKQWREVRAYVELSTGKTYLSKKLHKLSRPSWAKG
jgi:hypothetical protein